MVVTMRIELTRNGSNGSKTKKFISVPLHSRDLFAASIFLKPMQREIKQNYMHMSQCIELWNVRESNSNKNKRTLLHEENLLATTGLPHVPYPSNVSQHSTGIKIDNPEIIICHKFHNQSANGNSN